MYYRIQVARTADMEQTVTNIEQLGFQIVKRETGYNQLLVTGSSHLLPALVKLYQIHSIAPVREILTTESR